RRRKHDAKQRPKHPSGRSSIVSLHSHLPSSLCSKFSSCFTKLSFLLNYNVIFLCCPRKIYRCFFVESCICNRLFSDFCIYLMIVLYQYALKLKKKNKEEHHMSVTFDKSLETGNELIDQQHKE